MTRTRRMLLGATAGIALLAAGYSVPARAEIPVIDTAALGEWIVSLANELKAYALQFQQYLTQVKQYVGEELSWATQASQYATQLQQYANEVQMFINFVHYPNLGMAMALLSSAGLGNGLPVNPYAVLGLVNGFEYGQGGLPEISGIMSSLSGIVGRSYATSHVSPCVSIVAAYIGSGSMGALDEGRWFDTVPVRSSKSAWSHGCCHRRGSPPVAAVSAHGWDQRCDAGALAGRGPRLNLQVTRHGTGPRAARLEAVIATAAMNQAARSASKGEHWRLSDRVGDLEAGRDWRYLASPARRKARR